MKALILTFSTILILTAICPAENMVDVQLCYGDTISIGKEFTFDIYLENDEFLGGLSLGFHIWSPDGVGWSWVDKGGYSSTGCLTVLPCSRMSPPEEVFDLGGLQFADQDMDGSLPDTLLFGGAALSGGIQPGPLQHMASLHFITSGVFVGEVKTVCIDSTRVGQSGEFVFVNSVVGAFAPTVAWEEGGRCYPVNIMPCASPFVSDFVTEDTSCTTYETIYIENAVTFTDYASGQVNIDLHEICNGTGDVTIIDNGDNTCDIQYIPSIEDTGKCVRIDVMALGTWCVYPPAKFSLVIHFDPLEPVSNATVDLSTSDGDTLFYGEAAAFLLDIENTTTIKELHTGLKIWSPDNAVWSWRDLGGLGASECVRIMPGSRLEPHQSVFDPTGLQVTEYGFDGVGVDTIKFTGSSDIVGLLAGDMQSMIAMNFMADSYTPDMISTICIDTCTSQSGGALVFADLTGAYLPTISWSAGGRCYPIKLGDNIRPELQLGVDIAFADLCNTVTVEDAAVWSHSGGEDIEISLFAVNNGSGETVITDNGDGTCDVSYTPAPEDDGQVIEIIIQALSDQIYSNLGQTHSLFIEMGNLPPEIDCGQPLLQSILGGTAIKSDITVDDCPDEQLTFALISGPGEINTSTGNYTWTPEPEDTNTYSVTVSVTDGESTPVECSFQVGVTDVVPGDVNIDGSCNVADAVYLISYIFRGGPPPSSPNIADVNYDCNVNIGDCIFLINYIFKGGDAPIVSDCAE